MHILVLLKMVPDVVEDLEIAPDGKALDLINEKKDPKLLIKILNDLAVIYFMDNQPEKN